MKCCSLLYLPPPTVAPAAILENLRRFPPQHDLIVFSEHDHDWPNLVKLKVSPEVAVGSKQSKTVISNVVFLTGLQIALSRGYTHALVLEADCRVGCEGWDEVIFKEYFERGCIVGGSLMFYNPASFSPLGLQRWQKIVVERTERNFPCPTYGIGDDTVRQPSCVFPVGALSVLDLWWMSKMFSLKNAVEEARGMGDWDMEIGKKLWALFAEEAYNKAGQLWSVFSGKGDVVTDEQARLDWLRTGKIVAVHSVKSNAQP